MCKKARCTVPLTHSNGFKRCYTDVDRRLLASMGEQHGQSSGVVLKKLCERAYKRFGQTDYQPLATI
ncbi:MAG: hypothetical protein ACNYPE_02405 [Candidatus Azotimanducaceae bacterium WSBS_2022_MAG_OTU7]